MEVDPRTAINRRLGVFSRCHHKQKHLLCTYSLGIAEAQRDCNEHNQENGETPDDETQPGRDPNNHQIYEEHLETRAQAEEILLDVSPTRNAGPTDTREHNINTNPVANIEMDSNKKLLKLRSIDITINLDNKSQDKNKGNAAPEKEPGDIETSTSICLTNYDSVTETGPAGAKKSLEGSLQINGEIVREQIQQLENHSKASTKASLSETNL